jgi:hypothetical protein
LYVVLISLREWIAPRQEKGIPMCEPHTIRRRPLIMGALVCAGVLAVAEHIDPRAA